MVYKARDSPILRTYTDAPAAAHGAYDAQAAAAYDYAQHQQYQQYHQYQQQHQQAQHTPAPEPVAPQEPLPDSLSEDPPSKVIHFRNVTSEITQARFVCRVRVAFSVLYY